MANLKRAVSILLSLLMAFSMLSVVANAAVGTQTQGNVYEHDAVAQGANWQKGFSPREYTIPDFADLEEDYGTVANNQTDPWIYYGAMVYEVAEGDDPVAFTENGINWTVTDHYVQPDDVLLIRWYLKSNLYIGSGRIDFLFDRTFFDIVPDSKKANLTYTASKDLSGDGLMNTGYPSAYTDPVSFGAGSINPSHAYGAGDNGFTWNVAPAMTITTSYAAPVAQNKMGIDEDIIYRWDVFFNVLKLASTQATVVPFQDDTWYYSLTVKVRSESEAQFAGTANETEVNNVTTDTVGHIGIEEMATKLNKAGYPTFWGIADNASNAKTKIKNFNLNATTNVPVRAMTYADYYTADANHTFIIGEPGSSSGFTATFMNNGVQVGTETGTSVTLPAAPVNAGFTFGGWSDGVSTYEAGATVALSADTTFTAVWKCAVKYYDGNDEYAALSALVDPNTQINLAAAQEKQGFAFGGWSDGSDTYGAGAAYTVTGNTDFTAVWDQYYTATFVSDGETVSTASYLAGQSIQFPNLQKNGYVLSWNPNVTVMPASNTTFTAVWTAGQTSISFETNGGTTIAPITGSYGDNVTAPADPSKTGYTFAGWYADSTLQTPYTFSTLPASPIIVYADWTANTYNAYFYIDGESEPYATIPVVFGQSFNPPALPVEEGYEFDEWNPSSFVMDSEDKTYTTTKSALQYNITFLNINGGFISDGLQTYGTVLQTPVVTDVPGKTFLGWTSDDSTFIPLSNIGTATVPARAATYTATYSEDVYTITYYVDNVYYTEQEYGFGMEVTAPSYTPALGRSFDGWVGVPETMPEGNISIYGTTSAIEYTITYYAYEGDSAPYATLTAFYNDATPEPAEDPVRAGYGFVGWDNVTTVTADATYYGLWNALEYDVTFTFGLAGDQSDTSAVTYGEQISANDFAALNAEITGYTLVWTYGGEPVQMPFVVPALEEGSVIAFVADYSINYYNIYYTIDGTNTYDVVNLAYGAEVSPIARPTADGYDFTDWAIATAGYNSIPATMPAEDITLNTVKSAHEYDDIWYDMDGETVLYTAKVPYQTAIPVQEIPSRPGYDNLYWYPQKITQESHDMTFTLKATASAATYTVNKYLQNLDGTYTLAYSQVRDSSTGEIAKASTADKSETGYVLNTRDSTIEAEVLGNNSTVLNCYLDRAPFVITKVDEAGTTQITYLFGETVAELTAAEKTGYNCTTWTWTRQNGTPAAAPTTMPAYNLTATAVYTVRYYNFTPYIDGEAQAAQSVAYGTAVPTLSIPTKTGYSFSGWCSDANCTNAFDFSQTMPADHVNVYGKFTINSYTYTFLDDAGDTFTTITAEYNSEITAPAGPTKEGYSFSTWSPSVPATMGAENKTFSPVFTINKHSIIFMVDDAVYKTISNVAYNTEISTVTLPANPSKTGYQFNGWLTLPENMPDEDVTVTADFQIRSFDAVFYAVNGDAEPYATIPNVEFNSAFTAPDCDMDRGTYQFSGWTDGTDTYEAEQQITMNKEGMVFYGIWTQDTSACRVDNVERHTDVPYYTKGTCLYDITLKENQIAQSVTIQYTKEDGSEYISTYTKASFYVCGAEASGVQSIEMVDGREVWTIVLCLAEGEGYKAYISTEDFAETVENAYEFAVVYDVKDAEAVAEEFISCTIDKDALLRGEQATWEVVTSDDVVWIRFEGSYTAEDGTEKELVTYYKYNTTVSGVTVTDNAENGTRTWIIPMKFTYIVADDKILETWDVKYKVNGSQIWDTGLSGKEIVVARTQEILTPSQVEYAPYTLVSAECESSNAAVNDKKVFTIVTTDDCSKVRISYVNASTNKNKGATYQTTSANVVYSDDATTHLRTWEITYKFAAPAVDNQFSVDARGTSWCDPIDLTIVVE